MSRELQKDVEVSSRISRVGAVFGQHRKIFLDSTSADVQVQGRKVNCCDRLSGWPSGDHWVAGFWRLSKALQAIPIPSGLLCKLILTDLSG